MSPVSYTHLRAHETRHDLVCRLLLDLIVLQVRLQARRRRDDVRRRFQRPNKRVHLGALPAPHNHGVGRLAAVAEAARLVHGALAADGAGQLLYFCEHSFRAPVQTGSGVAYVNLGHVFRCTFGTVWHSRVTFGLKAAN